MPHHTATGAPFEPKQQEQAATSQRRVWVVRFTGEVRLPLFNGHTHLCAHCHAVQWCCFCHICESAGARLLLKAIYQLNFFFFIFFYWQHSYCSASSHSSLALLSVMLTLLQVFMQYEAYLETIARYQQRDWTCSLTQIPGLTLEEVRRPHSL